MEAFYEFLFANVASTSTFAVLVVLVSALLIFKKRTREGIAFALGAAGMGLTVWVLKTWLQVPRPEGALLETDTYAFPSGHATASMFLATIALLYIFRLKNPFQRYGLAVAVAGLALSIGASRVVYVVHTPLQVIAGFAIGMVWGLVSYALMRGVTERTVVA